MSPILIGAAIFQQINQYNTTDSDFRLTDCVESLFSVIRFKNSVSLYIRYLSRSNYEDDDRDYLMSFLDVLASIRERNFQILI